MLVGRSPEKTRRIGEELDSPYLTADFADLAQVRELAARLAGEYATIDVLVNNAGGIFGDRTTHGGRVREDASRSTTSHPSC